MRKHEGLPLNRGSTPHADDDDDDTEEEEEALYQPFVLNASNQHKYCDINDQSIVSKDQIRTLLFV